MSSKVFDAQTTLGPANPTTSSTFGSIWFNDQSNTGPAVLTIAQDPTITASASLGNFVLGAPQGLDFVAGPDAPTAERVDFFNFRGNPDGFAAGLSMSNAGNVLNVFELHFVRNPFAEFQNAMQAPNSGELGPDWMANLTPCRLQAADGNLRIVNKPLGGKQGLTFAGDHGIGFASALGGSIGINPWPQRYGTDPIVVDADGNLVFDASIADTGTFVLEFAAMMNMPQVGGPNTVSFSQGIRLASVADKTALPGTVALAPQGSLMMVVPDQTTPTNCYLAIQVAGSGAASWKGLALVPA